MADELHVSPTEAYRIAREGDHLRAEIERLREGEKILRDLLTNETNVRRELEPEVGRLRDLCEAYGEGRRQREDVVMRLRKAGAEAAELLADLGTDEWVNPPTAEDMQRVASELRELLDA